MESLQSFGRGDVLHVSISRQRSCVVIFAHNLLFRQVVFAATDFFMRFFGKVLNENVPLRLVFNLIIFSRCELRADGNQFLSILEFFWAAVQMLICCRDFNSKPKLKTRCSHVLIFLGFEPNGNLYCFRAKCFLHIKASIETRMPFVCVLFVSARFFPSHPFFFEMFRKPTFSLKKIPKLFRLHFHCGESLEIEKLL